MADPANLVAARSLADIYMSRKDNLEALKRRVRFAEISIQYSSRLGEIKLNPWRDGFYNLFFLVKKRFRRKQVK